MDGEAEQMEAKVVSASDGTDLRIQLPAVFGTQSSTAIFPVAKFDELASVPPTSSLHRFRLESLTPVHMSQALLAGCTDVIQLDSDENHVEDFLHFSARLSSELLVDLGLIESDEQGSTFDLLFELAAPDGKFVGLRVVGAESGITRFLLRINDTSAANTINNESFSLTIPEGHVIIDLSLQLPVELTSR